MDELAEDFLALKQEIAAVREKGYAHTEIIAKSESFFQICDDATGLAESYSQKKASSLETLETYITVDIVLLMLLIGYALFRALRYAAMNHDIRTPINGVIGMLSIIQKERVNLQQVDEYLHKIQFSAEHLLSLVSDVPDMSKLESGCAKLTHDPFYLSALLEKAHTLDEALADTPVRYLHA